MAAKSTDRCWPGYEPVPGKPQHSQGSCRKKAPSNSTPSEKKVQSARAAQLKNWKKKHPGSPTQAAQHLHAPASVQNKNGTTRKHAPPKAKPRAAKTATKRSAATRSTATRKHTAKKAA